jgi:hypothetical protein
MFTNCSISIKIKRMLQCVRKTFPILCISVFLAIGGCVTPSGSSGTSNIYQGYSRHYNVAREDTNLKKSYPDYPIYVEGKTNDLSYSFEAEDYLNGVKCDLERIAKHRDNANEKIYAVTHAVNYMTGNYFHVSYVGDPDELYGCRESNLPLYLGYLEFPEFSYFYPSKPIYVSEFSVMQYKHDLLDFAATVDDYIEDGRNYIRNCDNDIELIKKAGLEFIYYLEVLVLEHPEIQINFY